MTVTHLPLTRVEAQAPNGHVSSATLVRRAGITYRQLDYWTRTGLLHPAHRADWATSGTNRYYPVDQIHRAATLRWLLDAGIALQTCRHVIDELLATGQARLNDGLTIHLPQP